jgi:hypothetical protein
MKKKSALRIEATHVADESAIDVTLIDHNLRLSHEERIEAHESARQLVEDLQEAGREYRAQQSQTAT